MVNTCVGLMFNRPKCDLVSAWASSQSVTLGHLKVADHSNDPRFHLLEVLAISGCNTDARGVTHRWMPCGLCIGIESESRTTDTLFDGIADNQSRCTTPSDHHAPEPLVFLTLTVRGSLCHVVKVIAQREHNGQTTVKSRSISPRYRVMPLNCLPLFAPIGRLKTVVIGC